MHPHAAALKALLGTPGVHAMPGCADGMGARLIAEAGFKLGFVSGASASALRLAQPDMDLLSLPEMRDAVDMCTAAAPDVLWLADGDTGFGNALNVQRTVRACAQAGAAAVLIEDKVYPRPLGRDGRKFVLDRAEARLRCRAAAEACREAGILLLARTDATHTRGFGEALQRLEDFVAEGADILFLDSPQSEDEIRATVAACAGRPAMAVTLAGAKHHMPPAADLDRLGVKLNVSPHDLLAAAVRAMRGALADLQGVPRPDLDLASAIRLPEYLAADRRWATPD